MPTNPTDLLRACNAISHPANGAVSPLVVYLAGPMSCTGLPDDPIAWALLQQRAKYACRVQCQLLRTGIVSINPYSSCLDPGMWSYQPVAWYHGDLWLIKRSDAIGLLPGWEGSIGVTQYEIPYARSIGLPIYKWDDQAESLVEVRDV
jgi:hypothetical protein